MRSCEKYVKVFGTKGFEHPDVEFVTKSGTYVLLRWDKSEYRAHRRIPDGRLEEMRLGSIFSENLKQYIMDHF